MTDGSASAGGGQAEGVQRPVRGGFTATVAQWVEAHRPAVAGREPVIARDAGHRVARVWLPRSRIADVEAVAGGDADELEPVVELELQVGHPDLASDTALLEQVRQERAAQTYR
jgi:hypothetical protein